MWTGFLGGLDETRTSPSPAIFRKVRGGFFQELILQSKFP
jgi:hypothetical protein